MFRFNRLIFLEQADACYHLEMKKIHDPGRQLVFTSKELGLFLTKEEAEELVDIITKELDKDNTR